MYKQRKNKISVKQIANFLNATYTGNDFEIDLEKFPDLISKDIEKER